ncbi:MAG: peptide deformylase [Candidatus Wildermuthbacteria bacterium]|nr:peptide deformylase [Candidatus Wildermuthbacteria bacterium]
MKQFPLVIYPNPLLKEKSLEVKRITPSVAKALSRMGYTMDRNEGVGLAAPQVGIAERMIIVKDADANHVFLNPRIVKMAKKRETDEEGCLSLPGIFLKIRRAKEVEVEAHTISGEKVLIRAEGLGARIFQHEIDHLNGLLIIDRISPLAKFKIRKQLKKLAHEHRAKTSV